MKGTESIRSVKLSLEALKAFYKIRDDPLADEINLGRLGIFVNETRKQYIFPEQLEHIVLTEIPDYEKPLEVRDYTALLTFVNTGAKLSEVCKLTFEDYNIDSEKPFIRFNAGQKNQRDVQIDNCFMVYLHCALPFWNEALIQYSIKEPKYVFTSIYNREHMHKRMMEKIMSRYGVTAGQIRNTFLAKLQQKNINVKLIARLLGISEYNAQRLYQFVDKK